MLSHRPALTLLMFLLLSFSVFHLRLFSGWCPLLLPSWDLVSSLSSPSRWTVNCGPSCIFPDVGVHRSQPPTKHSLCFIPWILCCRLCQGSFSFLLRLLWSIAVCGHYAMLFHFHVFFFFFSVPGAQAFSFHLISMRRFLIWFQSPSVCYVLFYALPCDTPILGRFPYALRKNEHSSLWSE